MPGKTHIKSGKKTKQKAALSNICRFGYDHILQRAKTVDVTWFNERNMPANFFEVDHSTPIQNSLLKFMELRDFYTSFFVVADSVRKTEFDTKLSSYATFTPIRNRTGFIPYEEIFDRAIKL